MGHSCSWRATGRACRGIAGSFIAFPVVLNCRSILTLARAPLILAWRALGHAAPSVREQGWCSTPLWSQYFDFSSEGVLGPRLWESCPSTLTSVCRSQSSSLPRSPCHRDIYTLASRPRYLHHIDNYRLFRSVFNVYHVYVGCIALLSASRCF